MQDLDCPHARAGGLFRPGRPLTRGRRQVLVLLLLAILTAFTAIILVARRPGMGRVLLELTDTQGVHAGDIPVVGLWLVGMVSGMLLLRDTRAS